MFLLLFVNDDNHNPAGGGDGGGGGDMCGCGGDDDDILGHEIHVTQGALVGVTEKGEPGGAKTNTMKMIMTKTKTKKDDIFGCEIDMCPVQAKQQPNV